MKSFTIAKQNLKSVVVKSFTINSPVLPSKSTKILRGQTRNDGRKMGRPPANQKQIGPQKRKQQQQLTKFFNNNNKKQAISPRYAQNNTSFSFSDENPFDALSVDEDEDSVNGETPTNLTTQNRPPATTKKSPSPPPITVMGSNMKTINNMLRPMNLGKDTYSIKFTRSGIKIYANDTDCHRKLQKALEDSKIKFFTHQLREDQLTKIVLHGLHEMGMDELMTELKDVGVHPAKVSQMRVKTQKYDDHCVYLLYFKKSEKIKISSLRSIRAVAQVRVSWEYYQSRNKGPTQCSNCMLLGHGAANCGMTSRCIRCVEEHHSSECPKLIDPAMKRVPQEKLQCVLCGGNHSAVNKECKERKKYVKEQKDLREKSKGGKRGRQQQQLQPKKHNFEAAPELQNFRLQLDPTAPAWTQPPQPQAPQRPTITRGNQSSGNDDLLPAEVLMQAFSEIIQELSSAQNRSHQLSILGKIAIKYINYGSK